MIKNLFTPLPPGPAKLGQGRGALRSEAILDFLSRLCQLSKRLNSISFISIN